MHSTRNPSSPAHARLRDRPQRTLAPLALAIALIFPAMFTAQASNDAPKDIAVMRDALTNVAIARGRVEVQGGMHELAGHAGEVVHRIHVAQGDRVQAGMPLVEMERARQAYQRDIALAEQRQAKSELDALAGRLPYEKAKLRRLKSAAAHGGMEAQRLADADEALRELQANIATATRVLEAAGKRAELARWEFERRVLRAQADGVVLRVNARIGGESSLSKPLLTLLPDAALIVRAEVGANFVSRVRPGMYTKVVMDAQNEGNPIEAQVANVSSAYVDSGFGEGSSRAATRVLESIVTLPDSSGLQVGQLVRVKFYE